MDDSIDEKVMAYSRVARLTAYDISATFGDGQPGRIEKRLLDKNGKHYLDSFAWEAGDIAYQGLKQIFPNGITGTEFVDSSKEYYFLVRDDLYPLILGRAEAGTITIEPRGVAGLKEAWASYDWCERVMFAFTFIDELPTDDGDFQNPLNTVLPLVLLQRLDDAVIAEIMDGHGLPGTMLEIASLRDRLQPPKHLQKVIQKLQFKLDTFAHARRKGADAIHAENRAMKAEVFIWLDSITPSFTVIEAAARAIVKQQPIRHDTARNWFKEWKKLRSASTPLD